jgi:hypothetical protein
MDFASLNPSEVSLDSLPVEIVVAVVQLLDLRSLASLSLVSRHCHELTYNPVVYGGSLSSSVGIGTYFSLVVESRWRSLCCRKQPAAGRRGYVGKGLSRKLVCDDWRELYAALGDYVQPEGPRDAHLRVPLRPVAASSCDNEENQGIGCLVDG